MPPLLMIALVAGCTATAGPTGTPSPTADADPAYCAELRPTITAISEDELKATGVVVYVRSAELGDCFISIGTRVLGEDQPIGMDDQFRIGSNTKTMTGTVILQLAQAGALSLDDPVSKYRDDVPNGDEITIDQMLTMRSGLVDYSDLPELTQAMDETPDRVWTPDEVLALSFAEPPAFPPGEGYLYSNANTVLLGLIIEQLTGTPVEEAFQTRLFEPLGMESTLLPPLSSDVIPEQHAHGYMFGTVADVVATGGVLTPAQIEEVDAGTLLPNDVTDNNPSWGWAAGAGISTTADLADWAEALVGGGLLDDEMQKQRLESPMPVDPDAPDGSAYGQAIARYGALYGHTGELPGYNSFMGHDPVRDITVIAWSNLMSAPDGRLTANVLSQAVIDELYPG